MEPKQPSRYIPWEEIPRLEIDWAHPTTEPEAWWEWPGMFWRWSTGPIRRLAARLQRG